MTDRQEDRLTDRQTDRYTVIDRFSLNVLSDKFYSLIEDKDIFT